LSKEANTHIDIKGRSAPSKCTGILLRPSASAYHSLTSTAATCG